MVRQEIRHTGEIHMELRPGKGAVNEVLTIKFRSDCSDCMELSYF